MWSERTETKEIRDITQEMIKPAPLNSMCDVIDHFLSLQPRRVSKQ